MSSLHLLEILQDPGPDAWLQFIERVFGPLREEDGIPADVLAGQRMPEVLRRYYLVAGRKDLHKQNHFLTPERPEVIADFGNPERRGDKLPIYVENQGIWLCATATEGDDPPVWVEGDGIDGWALASSRLSVFLLHALLLEFHFTAPTGAGCVEPLPADQLAALLAPFVQVAEFSPVPWFRIRIFATDDLVLIDDGVGFVYVLGKDPRLIDELGLAEPDWERG